MRNSFVLMSIIALIVCVPTSSPAQTWDAVADYSEIANPSGVWEYGMLDQSGVYQKFQGHWDWDASLGGWAVQPQSAFVGRSRIDHDYLIWGLCHVRPTQLVMHTPADSTTSVLRFHVPENGLYRISASFEALDVHRANTRTTVHVCTDAGEWSHTMQAVAATCTYSSDTLELARGASVWFLVTDDDCTNIDDIGVSVTVNRVGDAGAGVSIDSISEIERLPLGTKIHVDGEKVVIAGSSMSNNGTFNIEEPDRSSGIRVLRRSVVPAMINGDRITLNGVVNEDLCGRYIRLTSINSQSSGQELRPIDVNSSSFRHIASSAASVNWLFVKICGRVTYVSPSGSFAYIDDGGGLDDGTDFAKGVRVIVPINIMMPGVGEMVAIKGVAGSEQVGNKKIPAIHLSDEPDILGKQEDYIDADWIWAKVTVQNPFQFVQFRKDLNLSKKPSSAVVHIGADTFYRLWVNGQIVMHGPARSSVGRTTLDVLDIASYLHSGTNNIFVECFYGMCRFEALSQAPGFICRIDYVENGKNVFLSTDASWEASEILAWNRNSPAFSFQRGWVEDYDANWTASWQPVVVIGKAGCAPWKKMEIRDIPLPAPLASVKPVSVVGVQMGSASVRQPEVTDWIGRLQSENVIDDSSAATTPAAITSGKSGDTVLLKDGAGITYDFGKNYAGFISFDVTGTAGQVLELTWNERLSADGKTVRPMDRLASNLAMRYTLRGGRQVFVAYTPQLIRYCRIVLRGNGPVTLNRLWVTEYRFGASDGGRFSCSDSDINSIYESARWTAMLNTVDTFMDCPSRERGAWFHDSYWTAQAVYTMFGDITVNRRMVRQGAESQGYLCPPGMIQMCYPGYHDSKDRYIPGHALFWVLQAGLDERFTSDMSFVRTMLPSIRFLLATFERWRNSDGLLENVPSWNFLDWADIRTDGTCLGLNAVYIKVLHEAARLERLAGSPEYADEYESCASKAVAAINNYCGDAGWYPDVLVRDSQGNLVKDTQACETTQYFLMWAGVPSPERTARMWSLLRDKFKPTPDDKVQPIDGLTRAGMYSFFQRLQIAVDLGDYSALVRDVKDMFLPMVQSAPGTLWEHPWSIASLCHGFSSAASAFLSENVLGIHTGFPVVIAPHSGGTIKWCSGEVTTPKGKINVYWNIDGPKYMMFIGLAEGMSAQVDLPDEAKAIFDMGASSGWRRSLTINGSATIIVEPGAVSVN